MNGLSCEPAISMCNEEVIFFHHIKACIVSAGKLVNKTSSFYSLDYVHIPDFKPFTLHLSPSTDQRVPSLAPQESPLSGQLEEETLTVEGELREIQDLLSMFTQPHPPQDVGVARSCESNPRQTHEEGPTASTMLSQSSKQSTQTGNSTPVSPYEGALVTGVEESPLVECAETQAGEVMSGASVGIPDTGGMFKDVEFDSVLSELQCIEGRFIIVTMHTFYAIQMVFVALLVHAWICIPYFIEFYMHQWPLWIHAINF